MKKNEQSIAIIGLGKTGLSVAKYLKKINKNFVVYDTRNNLEINSEIKKYINRKNIILGEFEDFFISKHEKFIISPGVNLRSDFLEEIERNNKILITDIDIFNEQNHSKTICITGSNGKTTVTSILENILKGMGKHAKAGGNIGLPVLELLIDNLEYSIIELSSFQLEMTKNINCDVATITNITPDHLDRHKTFENYINIKHKIFDNAKTIIINRDDNKIKKEIYEYKYSFGSNAPFDNNCFGVVVKNNKRYIFHGNKEILCEDEILLVGIHNLVNICNCLSIILSLGLSINEAKKHIKSFKCLDHRMEKFLEQDKINWINDSKATNIDSTISAIKSLEGKIILILGGRSKTNNYSQLKQVLDDKILRVIIYGECKAILKKELSGNNNIDVVENIHEAVKIAKKYADYSNKICGITILLSPACSSYDMFKSYEERGINFKKNVMEIYR